MDNKKYRSVLGCGQDTIRNIPRSRQIEDLVKQKLHHSSTARAGISQMGTEGCVEIVILYWRAYWEEHDISATALENVTGRVCGRIVWTYTASITYILATPGQYRRTKTSVPDGQVRLAAGTS